MVGSVERVTVPQVDYYASRGIYYEGSDGEDSQEENQAVRSRKNQTSSGKT